MKNKFQNLPLWPDFTPSKGKKKYRLNWTSREIHTEVFSEFFQILQFPEINGGYWIVDQTIQKQNLQRIIQSIKDLLIQIFSKRFRFTFLVHGPTENQAHYLSDLMLTGQFLQKELNFSVTSR